jgi:hypothetical protein
MENNAERIFDLDTKVDEYSNIKEEERNTFTVEEEKQKNQLEELMKKFQKLYSHTRNFEDDMEARENEKSRFRSKMVNEETEKHNLSM